MKKLVKNAVRLTLGIGFIYLLLLVYPNVLFGNSYQYKNFQVYSDEPISAQVEIVLDDALRRIRTSELYDSNDEFSLYFCNDNWRFKFFTRNGNAGGVVNFLISSNVFIRQNDVVRNQVIPPKTWVNSLEDRPLSYFIAHETIHCLQRKQNQFLSIKVPDYVIEGYAEYIAKRETIAIKDLVEAYKINSPTMNPKNGRYDKYCLYVWYLIEEKGFDFKRLVAECPDLEKTLAELVELPMKQ